jgi:hypothetical protein
MTSGKVAMELQVRLMRLVNAQKELEDGFRTEGSFQMTRELSVRARINCNRRRFPQSLCSLACCLVDDQERCARFYV